MAKYRLKFSKENDAKYVSQLDLVRLFTRVFKRAEIEISYSEGFNPHPKMSIGLPLGIGITSECEFLDIDLLGEPDMLESIKALNRAMPIGIKFLAMQKICEFTPKVKDAYSATYIVKFEKIAPPDEIIEKFLGESEINVMKKTKSGEKLTDIRPQIFGITKEAFDTLSMELVCAPNINLKPETVVGAICAQFSLDLGDFSVKRVRICDKLEREFI